jgi:phage shock protein A
MAKDAVAALEATRQKLIEKLLKKRRDIEDQLKGLRYEPPRHEQPLPRET